MIDSFSIDNIVAKYREWAAAVRPEDIAFPALDDEIESELCAAKEALGVSLDEAYIRLSTLANGMTAGGSSIFPVRSEKFFIHASEGEFLSITDENLLWRNEYPDRDGIAEMVLYGKNELAFFVQHIASREFQLRSRVGPDLIIEKFSSFEGMLSKVFQYSLELGE